MLPSISPISRDRSARKRKMQQLSLNALIGRRKGIPKEDQREGEGGGKCEFEFCYLRVRVFARCHGDRCVLSRSAVVERVVPTCCDLQFQPPHRNATASESGSAWIEWLW